MYNIVVFSPTPSHPQNAGNRARIYALCRWLQDRGHRVIFIYFSQEGLQQWQWDAMDAQWDEFYAIKKSKPYRSFGQTHYLIDDWYQEGIGESVAKIVHNQRVDLILCNYIFQSKLLDFVLPCVTKVIDTHDKFSHRHTMLQNAGLEADFFYTVPEQEAIGLLRADRVLAIQSVEASFFESLGSFEVVTLGHIESERFLPYKDVSKESLVLGFIGSSNSVNSHSIKQFLEKFLCFSFGKRVVLRIAGSVCQCCVYDDERIECLGHVEELERFYEGVDVVINPLLFGSGLKIKSIEALSFGKPIVSTVVGFEGLESRSDYHQAKSIDEMMESIERLCSHLDDIKSLYNESKEIFREYKDKTDRELCSAFLPKRERGCSLIVTHINFWLRNLGSRNRLYEMVVNLLREIDLVVVYIGKKTDSDIRELESLGLVGCVVFLEDIEPKSDVDISLLDAFVRKHPVLEPFVSYESYQKLATFLSYYDFEKVIVEYLHLSYFLPLFGGSEVYLDTHDILYKRNLSFKKHNKKHWIDIGKDEEFALFDAYDYLLSIQKNEHDFLRSEGKNSLLVPYSFEIDGTKRGDEEYVVIFIGGDTLANRDAIEWFIDNVWGLFVESGYVLEIYGDICSVVEEDKKKRIFTKGRVDDLGSLYSRRGVIAINPVKIGGGLKIKNVEALCSGIALITTSEGAYGMEDGIDSAFLVADDAESFEDRLLSLMVSRKLRNTLAHNAIRYAMQNFHRDVCYGKLIKLLG